MKVERQGCQGGAALAARQPEATSAVQPQSLQAPDRREESKPKGASDAHLVAFRRAGEKFAEVRRAHPAAEAKLASSPEQLSYLPHDDVRHAASELLTCAKSLLKARGVETRSHPHSSALIIVPSGETVLGNLARALHSQGVDLMVHPEQLATQSTARFRAEACDLNSAVAVGYEFIQHALDVADTTPCSMHAVTAELSRLLSAAHPAVATSRVTKFDLDAPMRSVSGKLVSELLPNGLRRVFAAQIALAAEALAASGVPSRVVALPNNAPAESLILEPGSGSLGDYVRDIQSRGGRVIYNPGLLWANGALANHDVPTSTVTLSHRSVSKGRPTRTEAHEADHVVFTSMFHGDGLRHGFLGYLAPLNLDNGEPNTLTNSVYTLGYTREEIFTNVLDFDDEVGDLSVVAETLRALPAILRVRRVSEDQRDQIAAICRGARSFFGKELVEVDVCQARSLRSTLDGLRSNGVWEFSWSTYFGAGGAAGLNVPGLLQPGSGRRCVTLRDPADPQARVDVTLGAFYRRPGARVEAVVVEGRESKIPEEQKKRGTKGWLREFPYLDVPVERALRDGFAVGTALDSHACESILVELEQMLARDETSSGALLKGWEAVESHLEALEKLADDGATAGEFLDAIERLMAASEENAELVRRSV